MHFNALIPEDFDKVADYRSGSAEDISVEVAGVPADAKVSAWVHEGGEVRHYLVRRQIIA